ncbi:Fe2+-dependent dioxygenase [Caulobacter sp. KR2-114]|uniref:Fe2+-dependent dioxygenase n=1 Tax=Caulobacter sp. KR2-114 TaxID=3400912 RepID=UPI003C007907
MLVHVEGILSKAEVAEFRAVLERLAWVDGRVTAGAQSALAKRNLQIPEDAPEARALGERILTALGRNESFVSAALPLRVFPPLFNRYDEGMAFGTHIDNAVRFAGPVRYRTDVSCTLFLTEPEDYDGGELVIEDTYGEHAVKLPAGDMILYPATSRHRVEAVSRGSRWASFFWAQSMVKSEPDRQTLHDLDQAIRDLSARVGQGDAQVVALAGIYHNLVRRFGEA